MKSTLLKIPFLLFLAILFSCEKDDMGSSTVNNPSETNSNTWKMGSYSYVRGTSANTGSPINNISVVVVSTSGFESINGAFAGSGISFTFYGGQPGTYIIKSFETVGMANVNNPSLRYISATVGVGTQSPNSNSYLSQDSEVTAIVSIIDGKYHITISNPTVLIKSNIITGTGIPNAPNTFSFTCNDVF